MKLIKYLKIEKNVEDRVRRQNLCMGDIIRICLVFKVYKSHNKIKPQTLKNSIKYIPMEHLFSPSYYDIVLVTEMSTTPYEHSI